jgi:hypothetical protein
VFAVSQFYSEPVLPREAQHSGDFKGLTGSLGENPPIELQSVSTAHPKPSRRKRRIHDAATAELSVYDGKHCIGWIVEAQGVCVALTADKRPLGEFQTRQAAFAAINASSARERALDG